MQSLFPTSYPEDYRSAYRLYWSRANMPSADRLGNGIKAWNKVRHIRPENTILLRCITLYLDTIESTKRVRHNGRDERVEYQIKPHFSTWLADRGWDDYLERASIQSEQITEPLIVQIPSFKAHFYPLPQTPATKSAAQIIQEHRAKNNS